MGSELVLSEAITLLIAINPNAIKPVVDPNSALTMGSTPVVINSMIAKIVPGNDPNAFQRDFWYPLNSSELLWYI